jgi:hypothetical protein
MIGFFQAMPKRTSLGLLCHGLYAGLGYLYSTLHNAMMKLAVVVLGLGLGLGPPGSECTTHLGSRCH